MNIIKKIINLAKKYKKKKIVSIIIPAYNEEKRISFMIESLLSQTYKKIEIIIIDDGSTDNTYNVCKKYKKKDKRIKLYHQNNSGSDIARNLGLKHSKGYYIMFGDADDYYDVNAVETVVDTMQKENLDIVNYSASCIYDDLSENESGINKDRYIKKNSYDNVVFSGLEYFKQLICNNEFSCVVWSYAFKRKIICKNKIQFLNIMKSNNGDSLFTVEALHHAKKVSYIDQVLYYRKVHTNSVMTSPKKINDIFCYYTMINTLKRHYINSKKEKELEDYIQSLQSYCDFHASIIDKENLENELLNYNEKFAEYIKNINNK